MSHGSWIPIAAASAALAASLAATQWLASHSAARRGPMDHPNERSLHAAPIPRTGGLAVLLGLTLAWLLAWVLGSAAGELVWLLAAVALVAVVSFFDDLGEVSPRIRLIVQAVAALVILFGGMSWSALELPDLALPWPLPVTVVLSLLYIVWMTNLYNFMDGMDGLAGGMTLFGFSSLALLGWIGGEPGFATAAAGVAAAALGFLSGNFPPARIFLGDTGSSSLGLLAAGFSLWGAGLGLFPLWAAWLAFSPFIVDATWTLMARLARGERVWEAHRSHHYQRLVLSGWSHRKTLLRAYLLMAATSACAVAAPGMATRDQWMLLGAWGIIYLLVHFRVDLATRSATLGSP